MKLQFGDKIIGSKYQLCRDTNQPIGFGSNIIRVSSALYIVHVTHIISIIACDVYNII